MSQESALTEGSKSALWNGDTYFIVMTGGTISGLGKGTTLSSVGVILRALGWNVSALKIDPYLNVDAGTMSPQEHGEVFVLHDGGEVDLDLGNYERWLDVTLSSEHNITSGKIFKSVIDRERRGDYLGKTVQVIPHVTDAIQDWILRVAAKSALRSGINVCLVEVGGTVGDIESLMYLNALQQLWAKVKPGHFCMCHVSYVPNIGAENNYELKTKPTQHSIRDLRQAGLTPDFIMCRSDVPLDEKTKLKISTTCHVPLKHVISVPKISNAYHIPICLAEQRLQELICAKFGLSPEVLQLPLGNSNLKFYTMEQWREIAQKADECSVPIKIGLVGKYTGSNDSYKSVVEALRHAAVECGRKLNILWIDAEYLEDDPDSKDYKSACTSLSEVQGVICPGGFGDRGIHGKLKAAEYCRTNKVPFLGICLGLQVAVIEFARNVLNYPKANSTEFDPCATPAVVIFMPEINPDIIGGSMRLGTRATVLHDPQSLASRLYKGKPVIFERHRHRYEVNRELVHLFEENGFKFTGRDEKGQRMEIAEISDHPFYLCVQFHPEFTSRPNRPSPCFLGLIQSAMKTQV